MKLEHHNRVVSPLLTFEGHQHGAKNNEPKRFVEEVLSSVNQRETQFSNELEPVV